MLPSTASSRKPPPPYWPIPLFRAAANPKQLVKVMLSRYKPGMAYGTHVDNALMGGIRTDLSFTLFLKEPDTYEGGALVH